jgi:hypothetical protein
MYQLDRFAEPGVSCLYEKLFLWPEFMMNDVLVLSERNMQMKAEAVRDFLQ